MYSGGLVVVRSREGEGSAGGAGSAGEAARASVTEPEAGVEENGGGGSSLRSGDMASVASEKQERKRRRRPSELHVRDDVRGRTQGFERADGSGRRSDFGREGAKEAKQKT